MNLKRSTQAIAAAAAAGLSLMPVLALAVDQTTVKSIDVSTALDGLAGANAMEYYPELETDLELAMAERVRLSDDPSGVEINVEVQEISLDGATTLPASRDFNRMEGTVVITSPLTDEPPRSFPVRLVAVSGDAVVP